MAKVRKLMRLKAQSLAEYALLFAVISGAFMIMFTYCQRSASFRFQQISNAVSETPVEVNDSVLPP